MSVADRATPETGAAASLLASKITYGPGYAQFDIVFNSRVFTVTLAEKT